MCVPTLPLRRRAASAFVLFSFSAVGVLKRRGDLRADWCVFWQRASWQNRPSALGKNLLRPRTTRPSWCLSVHTKNRKTQFPSAAPRPTGADRKPAPPQGVNTSPGLSASSVEKWKKKRSPTQTRSGERPGARHSSELLCFQLVPLFLRRGNVFVQMTNWTSSLSPGYFDRSGKKEELLENVELWEKQRGGSLWPSADTELILIMILNTEVRTSEPRPHCPRFCSGSWSDLPARGSYQLQRFVGLIFYHITRKLFWWSINSFTLFLRLKTFRFVWFSSSFLTGN